VLLHCSSLSTYNVSTDIGNQSNFRTTAVLFTSQVLYVRRASVDGVSISMAYVGKGVLEPLARQALTVTVLVR